MVADYRLAPFHIYVFIHRYFLTHVNPFTNLSREPAYPPNMPTMSLASARAAHALRLVFCSGRNKKARRSLSGPSQSKPEPCLF
jgi:hypothetical protein